MQSGKAFLEQHEAKDLLRFLTAGSVDDGKSTLIGRLLHDSKTVYDDHLKTLKKDSVRMGSAGGEIDYSLLLDGLRAEREQGITIDVAYRYFSTPRRKFIIADTPGHEQYTRNMATGGSTADLAIILVDASQGILPQTRRHSFIAALLGIRHVVLAVNKMDLVNWDREVFEEIAEAYTDFATRLEVSDVHILPMSALEGDNVVERSERMPWFQGSPLLHYLETVHIASDRNLVDLRFPVQLVTRPNAAFRGYAGTMAAGIMRPGDPVVVLPSGKSSRIESIVTWQGELDEAYPPQAITVTLEDELDVSRGDMIVHPNNLPRIDGQLEAMIVWMSEADMRPMDDFVVKHCCQQVTGRITRLRYRIDVNTLRRQEAKGLALNEIGRCVLELNRPIAHDPYERSRHTGNFILIDRLSNETVAAGMILSRRPTADSSATEGGSRPSERLVPSVLSMVSDDERFERWGHKATTVWFTGLYKAGKSTLACALERRLFEMDCAVLRVDGGTLRSGLSGDLGFSVKDRSENVRRAAGVARLCNAGGQIAICALVSPFEVDRATARRIVGDGAFLEIYLTADEGLREKRDEVGLLERARKGEIGDFTGVTAPYEVPRRADLVIDTGKVEIDAAVERIVELLREKGILSKA